MNDTALDLRQRDRDLDGALDPLDEAQVLDCLTVAYAARIRAVLHGPATAQTRTAQKVEHLERLCLQRRQRLADVANIDMSVPEAIDSRTRRALGGASRVAVLQALRGNADLLDVQTIAERAGLHTDTVRSDLDQLMDAGQVEGEVQMGTKPGRPRLLFRATATPGPALEGS